MQKDIQLSFTDREITPWGGMALMGRMLKKMDFQSVLQGTELSVQGSNRGYAPGQLIEQFLISVWCGANRFEHLEVTRHDEGNPTDIRICADGGAQSICAVLREIQASGQPASISAFIPMVF